MNTGLGFLIPLSMLLFGIGSALFALAGKPKPAALYLVFLMPLATTRERLQVYPGGAQIVDMLWVPVLLGILMREGKAAIPKSPLYRWLIALGVFSYLSLWFGSLYIQADLPILPSDVRFSDWKNYMVMPLIAVTLSAVFRTRRDIQQALTVAALSSGLVCYSFYQSTEGRDFSHFAYALRDAGVIGYAGVNGFAAFIAQVIVFLAVLLMTVRSRRLLLPGLGLLAFSIYGLLFAFSRGAYFATLAGLTVAAVVRQRALLIPLVALVVFWQAILPQAVQERINMTYSSDTKSLEPSAGDRVLLWEDAMDLFTSSPIVGTGYDTYGQMHRVADYKDTHNYYIKAMVEGGAIGLLLILGLMGRFCWAGMHLFRIARDRFFRGLGLAFGATMVCTAVANFFGDRWTYLQVDGYLWVALACVLRATAIEESEAADPVTVPATAAWPTQTLVPEGGS